MSFTNVQDKPFDNTQGEPIDNTQREPDVNDTSPNNPSSDANVQADQSVPVQNDVSGAQTQNNT
ncbi:MAG TPA: hypothetical protein VIK81_03475, partial [Patescibacteria group bacterium]